MSNERAAIIENSQDRALGIPEFVKQNGIKTEVFKIHAGESLPEPDDFKFIITSGGPMGVYDLCKPEYSYLQQEIPFLKRAIDHGQAILGICFGHQLLAHTLGGEIARAEHNAEVGWSEIEVNHQGVSDPLFKNMPSSKLYFFQYHNDQITKMPAKTVCLAKSKSCKYQSFRLVSQPIWGVQFHPEIDSQMAEKILTARKDVLAKMGIDVSSMIQKGNSISKNSSELLFSNFLHCLE